MIARAWFVVVHLFLKTFFSLFCGLKVKGIEKIKIKGAFIMVGNHTSYYDPPLFGAISHRIVHCMAKKELFSIPVLGPILWTVGAFPVDRESNDTWAVKHAIKLLKSGEIFGIFPEGQRVKEGDAVEPSTGVALIAKQTGVPVVPVSIIGADKAVVFKNKIPKFGKVRVIIGDPIVYEKADPSLKEKENMKIFTDKIMDIIKTMAEQDGYIKK